MYYKAFSKTRQLLGLILLYGSVAFKQQTAEEQQTPCLEPCDLGQSEDRRHQPVLEQHHGQTHQSCHKEQNGHSHYDCTDDLSHLLTLLMS